LPIFQSQNNFRIKRIITNTNEATSKEDAMSKLKKYIHNTKGDNTKPKALSKSKEKNIVNLARLLNLNKNPKVFTHINLSKKNTATNRDAKTISRKSIISSNLTIIRVKFIVINKNVSKLTLSVNALSSLKY
jgi:hypothetical protein